MILVDGVPIISQVAGADAEALVRMLLRHPSLFSSARVFASTPATTFKAPSPSGNNTYDPDPIPNLESITTPNFVYVFQREYAVVNSYLAPMLGTDDLTTCMALVLRDPASGRTGLGHFDSIQTISRGVEQLVNSIVSPGCGILQVHIMGAFDDSPEYVHVPASRLPFRRVEAAVGLLHEDLSRHRGYSWALAVRMVNVLQSSVLAFEITTCCILDHLTVVGFNGHPAPVARGCMVETSTGAFFPAAFEAEARGPDSVVRQACAASQHTLPNYVPELLSPYITETDMFSVSPMKWDKDFCLTQAPYMLSLPDEQLLLTYSTSPYAEGPNFLLSCRSLFQYWIQFPRWEETFPAGLPRIFTRNGLGGWKHFTQGSV